MMTAIVKINLTSDEAEEALERVILELVSILAEAQLEEASFSVVAVRANRALQFVGLDFSGEQALKFAREYLWEGVAKQSE